MLELFEGSLAIGMVGLVGMAGMQFGHGLIGHDAGGLHLGDGGHAGGLHLGDGGHAGGLHLGDGGHAGGLHLGDIGHLGGLHVGDAGHAGALHVGDAGHAGGVHAGDAGHAAAHAGHGDASHGGEASETSTGIKAPLWLIPSPITVFSLMIGFGLAGIVFRTWFPMEVAAGIAVVNAIVFERFVVRPYWEWIFRFASTPGTMLEGAVATKAVAVTSFNARGRGLVRLTVDGQDRDVLARLMPGTPRGAVRKGDTLFVERADEDNSVLVSKPDSVA